MSVGSEVSSELTLKDFLVRDCLLFAGYILLITDINALIYDLGTSL